MSIQSTTMRKLWAVVENVPSWDLVNLSDHALSTLLLQEVLGQAALTGEEMTLLSGYIGSKLILIRDMANSRRSGYLSQA